MTNHLSHFAVSAEDTQRAMKFYETVFGWAFEPYGPPGFYILHTDGAAKGEPGKEGPGKGSRVMGALQKRFEVVPGYRLTGYECTISTRDITKTAEAVQRAGGKILMPKAVIPGVGALIRFADSEGNVVCAMQYDDPTL
jgi:uncharacterized protein